MTILQNPIYKAEAAALADMLVNEHGECLFETDRGAAVRLPDGSIRCVFADVDAFSELAPKGELCVMNMPIDFAARLGSGVAQLVTFAYLRPMPPPAPRLDIRRLAPSLAESLAGKAGVTVDAMRELLRSGDVFGAIVKGKLAGFVGRKPDGTMGLFDLSGGGDVAVALESFLITYIMTFGRVPIVDVDASDPIMIELQQKLGLTAGKGRTVRMRNA